MDKIYKTRTDWPRTWLNWQFSNIQNFEKMEIKRFFKFDFKEWIESVSSMRSK